MCEFQDMNEITAENCDVSDRNTIDSDSADMDINFSDSMDMDIDSSDPDELDDDTCEDDICKQDDYYSRSILNDYLKQIASYPRLSEEETRELLLRKDTDPSARTKLINHNLRLGGCICQRRACADDAVRLLDLLGYDTAALFQTIAEMKSSTVTGILYLISFVFVGISYLISTSIMKHKEF